LFVVLHQICRDIAELKQQQMYHTQMLQDLTRTQRGIEKEKVGQLPSSCHLPLTTYKQVLELEQQLKSKQFVSCSTALS